MNPIKELINDLKNELLTVSGVTSVLKQNTIMSNFEQYQLAGKISIGLSLGRINWSNGQIEADYGKPSHQIGTMTLGINIFNWSLKNDLDATLDGLDIVDMIYGKIALMEGEKYSKLVRTGQEIDENHDGLQLYLLEFSVKLTDYEGENAEEIIETPLILKTSYL
jgi:hypothetical protein